MTDMQCAFDVQAKLARYVLRWDERTHNALFC